MKAHQQDLKRVHKKDQLEIEDHRMEEIQTDQVLLPVSEERRDTNLTINLILIFKIMITINLILKKQ